MTPEELRAVLHYSADTGVFTWKQRLTNRVRVGDAAGSETELGYVTIMIRSRRYLAHRLAWLYIYGVWPTGDIDHMNRKAGDNRIANLRDVTHAENLQNRLKQANNKSGHKGVTRFSKNRWTAEIRAHGVRRHLGYFASAEEAAQAYARAAAKFHFFNPKASGADDE